MRGGEESVPGVGLRSTQIQIVIDVFLRSQRAAATISGGYHHPLPLLLLPGGSASGSAAVCAVRAAK